MPSRERDASEVRVDRCVTGIEGLKNIIPFDFFEDKLVKGGQLHFLDLPVIYDRLGLDRPEFDYEEINILVDAVVNLVGEMRIRRLVLESITSVTSRLKSAEILRESVLRLTCRV